MPKFKCNFMQICQKTDTEPNIHQPVVDPWGWVDHPFVEKKMFISC